MSEGFISSSTKWGWEMTSRKAAQTMDENVPAHASSSRCDASKLTDNIITIVCASGVNTFKI